MSAAYPGNTTDKAIVQHDGILKQLKPGDGILADKGFLMEDLIPEGKFDIEIGYCQIILIKQDWTRPKLNLYSKMIYINSNFKCSIRKLG